MKLDGWTRLILKGYLNQELRCAQPFYTDRIESAGDRNVLDDSS